MDVKVEKYLLYMFSPPKISKTIREKNSLVNITVYAIFHLISQKVHYFEVLYVPL